MRSSTDPSSFDRNRRHSLVPGGAHTYSRGDDQYPLNAPEMLVRGLGATLWAADGREFIDWGMGLRSVILGYADARVDQAVTQAMGFGVNLSRPVPEEFLLAERLIDLIPSAEMVKFGKNGSDATAGAIRLARAATGRARVMRSDQDPFLGVHDWFIGSTVMQRGIPRSVSELTHTFKFNDLSSVQQLLDLYPGEFAAIILEPVGRRVPSNGFLTGLRELATKCGVVLVFDETITGFRLSMGGAQEVFGVTPDLSTFGKAMGNGFPISALAGSATLMSLGGIRHASERVFLMSSTYGSERVGLAAAMATIEILEEDDVCSANALIAGEFMREVRGLLDASNLSAIIRIEGLDINPYVTYESVNGIDGSVVKTILMQLMVERGIMLAPFFVSFAESHRGAVVQRTLDALEGSLQEVHRLIADDALTDALEGPPVAPVFRRFN